MATVQELENQVKTLNDNIARRSGGGATASPIRNKRTNDGLLPLGVVQYYIDENLKKQEIAKAAGNTFGLEDLQRIYRNLISEQLAQERAIAGVQAELAQVEQELETARSNQAQQDAAKGQTAAAPTTNGEAAPLVVPEALSAGLSLVVSKTAAANLDTSLPFIHVLENGLDETSPEIINKAINEKSNS